MRPVEPNTVDSISEANLWTEECLEDTAWWCGKQHKIACEEQVWTSKQIKKHKPAFDTALLELCSSVFSLDTAHFYARGLQKKCTCKSFQSVSAIWPSQGSDVSGVRWAPRGPHYVFICDMWGCVCICEHESERWKRKTKVYSIKLWEFVISSHANEKRRTDQSTLMHDCAAYLQHCRHTNCLQVFALESS